MVKYLRYKISVDAAHNTLLTCRMYDASKSKRIYQEDMRDTNSKAACGKRFYRRKVDCYKFMDVHRKEEFQIWFVEFHSNKDTLTVAELITYIDERLSNLKGQGIDVVNFFYGYHDFDNYGCEFPHLHSILITRCGKGNKRISREWLEKQMKHITGTKRFSIHVESIRKSHEDFQRIANYIFDPEKVNIEAYQKVRLLHKLDYIVEGYLTNDQWAILTKQLERCEYEVNGYTHVVYRGVLTEGMVLRVQRWIAGNQSQDWYPSTQ